MDETKTFLDACGGPDGRYPMVDLDAADEQRHTVIVNYAGGIKKALVQFMGLAGGTGNAHLCLYVHAFVDDHEARSSVLGMDNGAHYAGFDETEPGRSHGQPAVRLIAVLIGAQSATPRAGLTTHPAHWRRGHGRPLRQTTVRSCSTPPAVLPRRHIAMTHDAVTLHDSYYLIHTAAWLDQRVGAHHDELSRNLQSLTGSDVFDEYRPAMDIAGRMQLWCAANNFVVGDGAVIEHDSQTLTEPLTVVLAATGGPHPDALALVSINGRAPEVYADDTSDEGYWLDHASIEIACVGGRYWTWDGGAYVHTADGAEQRITTVFGLGTRVITRCRACAAFEDGTAEDMCGCSGVAIYCPHCGQRARVRLPEVPTFTDLLR